VLIAVRLVLLLIELAFHGNYCTYIKSCCPPSAEATVAQGSASGALLEMPAHLEGRARATA
jgi:hypothetical protein